MGRPSIPRFLREQWTDLPLQTRDLREKTFVITGANGGLGFEAALHLAKMSPGKLILAGRDDAGTSQARRSIEEVSGSQHVSSWPLDLASFDSVRNFVDKFEKDGGGRLDGLLENAGMATRNYSKTQDGWETTLQVNYLSNALLSILLLPHLLKEPTDGLASRIAIVSSDAHYMVNKLDIKDMTKILMTLNGESYCTPAVMAVRYKVSKLLTVFFVREFAARLVSTVPVVVSAVNPGVCHSRLTRESQSKMPMKWFVYAFKAVFARTTEMGSRTLVHTLTAPDEEKLHGHYVSNCEVTEESDYVLSSKGQEISRNIWTETIEILSKVDPRVTRIVSDHLSRPLPEI